MGDAKKWHALYTRQGREKKVSEILTRKKIENYCPTHKVVRPWIDLKKPFSEPLFTSYVFVRITADKIPDLRQIDGVLNFVYWLDQPAVISHPEIEAIKQLLAEYPTVKLERIDINAKYTIDAPESLLIKTDGNASEAKNRTVKAILPSIGYLLVGGAEANREPIFLQITEAQAG